MELKGSKTEANLLTAFSGESQAAAKYKYFSSVAKKEGYEQIAAVFDETGANESAHAEIWYKQLHSGETASTLDNLKNAAGGENFEWTEMYSSFAQTAKEEGFTEIASLFERIASIERDHEERYRKLIENIENGMVFKRDNAAIWKCRNCGYIHVGEAAPEVCPACRYPKAYFELQCKNY